MRAVSEWPVAVRSAELASGSLARCGPGVRGAGWPEDAEQRRLSLDTVLGPRLMPIRLAAAWVWGCARHPGAPLQANVTRGSRRLAPSEQAHAVAGLSVHELRYAAGAVASCAGLPVTSPLRTACDVLRLEPRFDAVERAACRLLLMLSEATPETLRFEIATGPMPGRPRALERLHALYGV